MANIDIPVSISNSCVVTCNDVTGASVGDTVTWKPDATILSISSIVVVAGKGGFNPAPSARNNWQGTIATADPLGPGERGVEYIITVNGKVASCSAKQRSPKIIVVVPVPEKKY